MASDVQRTGDGAHVVLCLHGWFGSSGAWGSIRPYLDGSTFRYYFPDYRGYGRRRSEAGEHSIAEAAADVLALADELGAERFSLVGHSMGGSVMQRVYADRPERVRAMVGISPVPASGAPFDQESWPLFAEAADNPGNRRAIIDLTTGNRLSGVWLDAMVQHSLDESDPAAFGDYLQAWANTDFHEEVEGATVPVQVVVGENDPALGDELMNATFQRYYPDSELIVFANAGHYALDETPIALVSTIERFLQQH